MATQTLNLDLDLSRLNNKLTQAGGNFEKAFDKAIKNVDKQFDKSFKTNDKKFHAAGMSAGESAGMGIADGFAVGIGASLSMAGISKIFSPMFSYIKRLFSLDFLKILKDLEPITKNGMEKIASKTGGSFIRLSRKIFDISKIGFFDKLFSKFSESAEKEIVDFGLVSDLFDELFELEKLFGNTSDNILDIFKKGFLPSIYGVFDSVKERIKEFSFDAISIFSLLGPELSDNFSSNFDKIKQKTSNVMGYIKSEFSKILSPAKENISQISNIFSTGFNKAFGGISKKTKRALEIGFGLSKLYMSSRLNDLGQVIGKYGPNISNSIIKSLFAGTSKTMSGVKKLSNGIIGGLKTAFSFVKMGAIFATIGVAITASLAFAIKSVFNFAKKFTDAFVPVRKSIESLKRSLSLKGKDSMLGYIEQLSGKIAMLTGTGQEDVVSGMSLALRKGINPKQLEAMSRIALNVMNDPANRVNNMQQAMELVTEAFEGSESAAKRLGINVKNTGDSSADMLARMKEISGQMSTIYGGQPQFIDASKQFEASFNSVKETVGKTLTPFVDGILKKMTEMIIGFVESGKLESMSQTFGEWLEWGFEKLIAIINWMEEPAKRIFNIFSGIFDILSGQIMGLWPALQRLVLTVVDFLAKMLSKVLGEKLSRKIGLEADFSEQFDELDSRIKENAKKMQQGYSKILDQIFTPSNSDVEKTLQRFSRIGAEKLAEAATPGGLPAGPTSDFWITWRLQQQKEREEALKQLADKAKELSAKDDKKIQVNFGIRLTTGGARRKLRRRK
jgi:hypothetical protein